MTNLKEALEIWAVLEPGAWENDLGPVDFYAVSNDEGIIAYFDQRKDAYRFRFAEINRLLNG